MVGGVGLSLSQDMPPYFGAELKHMQKTEKNT